MAGLKKLVAVTLAVTVLAAIAVYALRPTASRNTGTVVVNEPETPAVPGSPRPGDEPNIPPKGPPAGSGSGDGDEPSSDLPKPHGLYAQNSLGPKHAVCAPANSHVTDQARDEGANRYRGMCVTFPGNGPSA